MESEACVRSFCFCLMSSDAKRRVTRLVTFILYGTGNFGLFTEIPVCKFLRGLRAYSPKPFLFLFFISCPLYMFIHFSAAFCMAHCALDLARDHVP